MGTRASAVCTLPNCNGAAQNLLARTVFTWIVSRLVENGVSNTKIPDFKTLYFMLDSYRATAKHFLLYPVYPQRDISPELLQHGARSAQMVANLGTR